jgi:hypothetical protein
MNGRKNEIIKDRRKITEGLKKEFTKTGKNKGKKEQNKRGKTKGRKH